MTVIGLFGKEKCHDSNKAIEIFDHLAQRDIFSLMDRDDEEVSSILNNKSCKCFRRSEFGYMPYVL